MGLYVYIAGPYTKGDVAANVAQAITAANVVLNLGDHPYVPHLNHFWHLMYQHEYEEWLQLDQIWLERCEALIRLPGESSGADREVELARQRGLRVFYGLEEYVKDVLGEEAP